MGKQCRFLVPTEAKKLWFDFAFEIPRFFVNGGSDGDCKPSCRTSQVICDLPSQCRRVRFRAADFARTCAALLFILITFSATASAQSFKIEEAQCALQERYQLIYGNEFSITWPNKINGTPAPDYPQAGFYGDDLADVPKSVELVQHLALKLLNSGVLGHFVNREDGSIEGLKTIPTHDANDLPSDINASNYVKMFALLTEKICKLKYIWVQASQVGINGPGSRVESAGGFSHPVETCAMAKDWASGVFDFGWQVAFQLGHIELGEANWSDPEATIYNAALISIRGKIYADLSGYTNGTGTIYLKTSAQRDGVSNDPRTTADSLFHNYKPASGGSPYLSEALANRKATFTANCPYRPTGWFTGWLIDDQVAVVAPSFKHKIESCEAECSSCKSGRCTSVANKSVDVVIDLGSNDFGESAGQLRIKQEKPSPMLATPALLVPHVTAETEVINTVNGLIRQVHSTRGLADVIVLSDFKFDVRLYTPANVGSKDATGLYQPTGISATVVSFENPDGTNSFNRLRITETTGSNIKVSDFQYNDTSQAWDLIIGGGLSKESRSVSVDSDTGDSLKTFVIQNSDDSVAHKEIGRFHTFPWGEEQIQQIVDPDGSALITTWSFYENQSTDGPNYAHLKQVIQPNGYWERYEFDQYGRQIKVVAQYLDALLGAAETASRVTNTSYGSGDPAVTVVETLLGKEVSRRYTVYRPGEMREIQTQTPGALWTDPNNLVIITKTYLGTQFEGELQSVKNPDGAMSFYTYSVSGNQKTTTVKTGQPNASSSEIVSGTSTVTVVDVGGNTISETSYDIASNLLLTSATSTQFDDFGRPTRSEYNDGTFTTTSYGCCGVDSTTDREGITTTYLYDSLQRVISSTRAGITTLNTYDAEGRVLTTIRKGSDGSEITTNTSAYDVAGRLTSSTDALNHTTRFAETIDSSGHSVKTTISPNALNDTDPGATRMETSAQDGSLLSVTGTGVHPLKYEYGVDADGRFTKEIRVGNGGAETEWVKTYTDMLGRTYKTVSADGAVSQSFFNNKGQLFKAVDADGVTTLFAYNGKGEQEDSALDMNRNGLIDYSGADRITRTQTQVTTAHATTVRQTTTSVWTTDGMDSSKAITVTETSADGLRSWNSAFGLTTQTQTAYDGTGGRTATVINPDASFSVSKFQDGRLILVTQKDSANAQIAQTTFAYDAHGRLKTTTDARTGETSNIYDNADQLKSVTTPVPGPGLSAQTTSYLYDNLGRRTDTTLPDNGVVKYEYYDAGELKKTFGARTYLSEYSYDSQGRLKTLLAGTGTTTWNYDQVRGLLSSKVYDDGKGPSYAYTPGGRLRERDWVRGIATKYELQQRWRTIQD